VSQADTAAQTTLKKFHMISLSASTDTIHRINYYIYGPKVIAQYDVTNLRGDRR
jgi:hypothetical protein